MTETRHHPRFDPTSTAPPIRTLAETYRLVADLFVYPEDVDRSHLVAIGRERVVPALADHVGSDAADHMAAFLDDYEDVTVDEYVMWHELEPACPLYLGHYEFEEPETCREIADADRNQYMVELNGVYDHFGFELDGELPDYLPAMVEFCWLTLPDRGDELRGEFLSKTLSMLPGMREQFADHRTPYWRLLATTEAVFEFDESMPASEARAVTDGRPEPDDPARERVTGNPTGGEN